MNSKVVSSGCLMLCSAMFSNSATADTLTIGPNGINSAGLTLANGTPMTGGTVAGANPVALGEVDLGRAGWSTTDGGIDNAANSGPDVVPAGVFRRTTSGSGIANLNTTDHAEQVASVMIGKDTADPDGVGPRTAPTGVALGATLYSGAFDPGTNVDEEAAITANHLATLPGVDVRAINMSFGNGPDTPNLFDGNQLLTQFIDWSATAHEVLYVVAGNEGPGIPIPTDNFNGITVAASAMEGGVYRRVATFNTFDEDATGDRTSVGLLAPGEDVDLTALNSVVVDDGTSYAAPHVTSTVALLQQYANERIVNGGWNAVNSRRHETMKAVLLNSADKFIDNGTRIPPGQTEPVPMGGLLGMTRDVLKQPKPGMPNPTWFDSAASDDSTEGIGSHTPLDEEMGAGELNASRARTQFAAGEHNADIADVPVIGWDYGTTTGATDINRYQFEGQLLAKSFISITLAWDRKVEFATDTAPFGQFNMGDTFADYVDDGINPPDDSVIDDLDIYLLPKFAGNINESIAASDSVVGTLEHLFFQIPETGEYEFWVRQHDEDAGVTQNYSVAWWAMAELTSTQQGDYNGDHIVNTSDYTIWKNAFGTANAAADGNGNGIVDAADYTVWRDQLGQTAGSGASAVPELSSICLALAACGLSSVSYRRRVFAG